MGKGPAAMPSIRIPRMSLKTLLGVALLLAIPMSWFAWKLDHARDQRQTVLELQSYGAACFYDYQIDAVNAGRMLPPNSLPRCKHWSSKLLGEELWTRVLLVECYSIEIDETAKNDLLVMGIKRRVRWALMKARRREKMSSESKTSGLFPSPAPETPRFGDEQMHLLPRLHDLESLDLGYTYISDEGLAPLIGLRRLTDLRLQGTNVGDRGMEQIGKLTQLRVLHLNYTNVTDSGLVHIGKLKNLEKLFIWGTQIGDDGLSHLQSLKRLRVLLIFDTEVTDEGISILASMPSLQHVNIRGTRITPEGHESLTKALPDCKVEPKFW